MELERECGLDLESCPALEGAEVDEIEMDGLLQRVGIVTGEQNPGDVGLDELDAAAGVRVARRVEQAGQMFG